MLAKEAKKLSFNERVVKLTPSLTLAITAKAKAMKAAGDDVISFGAGEPDFDTPEPIKEACIQALKKGETKYTPESGTLQIKKAVCEKLKRENGLDYTPENIVVSCGAKHSIYNVVQVLVNPGDEVIIPAPYWLSYPEMVTLAGGKSVFIETTEKTGFIPTIEQIKKAITPKTKVFILNSPSNPTGGVWSLEDLKALAELAKEHQFFIISDEIYEKLVYEGAKHYSIASFDPEIKKLVITVSGMSKSYAMTGWRLGYFAAEKEIANLASSLQGHSTSNPTTFAQSGGVESLKPEINAYVAKMLESFTKRRKLMLDEFAKISKVKAFAPRGAFYIFVNISGTGMNSLDFSNKLLERSKVAVVPGAAFGAPNYIRLSFATSESDITNGVRRIAEFLKQ